MQAQVDNKRKTDILNDIVKDIMSRQPLFQKVENRLFLTNKVEVKTSHKSITYLKF